MSTTYEVVLALSTTGSLNATVSDLGVKAGTAQDKIAKLGTSAKDVGGAVEAMGSSMGSALGSMIDRVEGVTLGLAKMGAAAGVAGAVYGVAHLNNQLEQTQISMAAIFTAQGFYGSFEEGMRGAADQVTRMKQDVKSLPGDLGQLSNIMKTIATPAAQAGAGQDDIRKLAGNTMLIGQILGVQQEVAAREMGQLLSGRAGAHNILGTRLGFVGADAKKLNADSPEQRYAAIKAQMDKYSGAKDTFATSFVAQWTTAIDNVKYQLASPMTAPLFEHVKVTLGEVNSWFDVNHLKVEKFVSIVGEDLAQAWDKVGAVFVKLEPIAGKLIDRFENLKPGELAGGLEHMAGMGLLMKMAPSLLSGGGKLLGGAISGEGMIGGALAANPAILAAAAPLAMAGFGAVDNLTDKNSMFHDSTVANMQAVGKNVESVGEAFGHVGDALKPVADMAGGVLVVALEGLSKELEYGAKAVDYAIGPFGDLFKEIQRYMPGARDTDAHYAQGRWLDPTTASAGSHLMNLDEHMAGTGMKPRQSPSTNIQKVEIVVKGSDDPSRVARLTLKEIQNLGRNPTSSPSVPSYVANR